MKKLLIALVVTFLAATLNAQSAQESTLIVSGGYSTPSAALSNFPSGVFGDRASIVPVRMMPGYDPWIGTYDRLSYVVVRQASTSESGTGVSESSGMPATSYYSAPCYFTVQEDSWLTQTFTTVSAAKSYYSSLDPLIKAYAELRPALLPTSRWLVTHPTIAVVCN